MAMANMGNYCKAYSLRSLRAFAEWTEEEASGRTRDDDDYVFLQESLVVTGDIFVDEDIIYNSVTPAWENFCREALQFEVPDFVSSEKSSA
jgi:hypothetical protein